MGEGDRPDRMGERPEIPGRTTDRDIARVMESNVLENEWLGRVAEREKKEGKKIKKCSVGWPNGRFFLQRGYRWAIFESKILINISITSFRGNDVC